MQLGTSEWLLAVREAINESSAFATSGKQWKHPLGLGFVTRDGDDEVTRHVVLDLYEGRCQDARVIDAAEFDELPFALTASYERWRKILAHDLDLMRCIVLNRVEFRGDRFAALRFLPAAKALLDACSSVSETSATA